MTDIAWPRRATVSFAPALYACAVFASAALVFLVEPMIAQLLLPRLGGSPAVWNTSLAFFQAALLVGYGYAHLLQRIGSVRRQVGVHLAVLGAAALSLPLHIAGAFGQSSTDHPIVWLLGVLVLSIGAPFAALSATAPLLQAWFGRLESPAEGGKSPYVLYASSNLGSLLALLAYPFVVQPLLGVAAQTATWTIGYGAFALVIAALGASVWNRREAVHAPAAARTAAAPLSWKERISWVLLAAAPSSLLLGVTSHITTDVASAPFLWVIPLALYLLTFVIAFQERPAISRRTSLLLQAPTAAFCLLIMPSSSNAWLPLLAVHLLVFFVTALMCHQTLAERRPPVGHLTEFYLLISLGGVVGGAFNAFAAPVLFNGVWEYPIVLVLAGLARPWGRGALSRIELAALLAGLGCALAAGLPQLDIPWGPQLSLLALTALAAVLLRGRAPAFVALIAALALSAQLAAGRYDASETRRSFFGVVQIGMIDIPNFGPVRVMMHGSTLHGAQALDPARACTPMLYYAPGDPIGQAFRTEQARSPRLSFGAVGLGSGAVAAYVRPGDAMRFFEIDPLVTRLASDPARFSYMKSCAKGPVDVVLGDARLSLAKEPAGRFDVLLVDAFSSDSVPTHLMTVEALKGYLRVVKPDGVVVMHLSNRNLELLPPAVAAWNEAGAMTLTQTYFPPKGTPLLKEARSIVIVAARSPEALQAFENDRRWRPGDPSGVRPWTDDYSNVLGALIGRMRHPLAQAQVP